MGELAIAAAVRSGGELGGEAMRRAQTERVDALALNLKVILRRYVEGDDEGFVVSWGPPGVCLSLDIVLHVPSRTQNLHIT